MNAFAEPPDILIVEDDTEYVQAAIRALVRERVSERIFVVRDGQEALEFLFCRDRYRDRGEPGVAAPKVILLDLNLPFVDGLELLRRLKQSDATRNIPVVMFTSSEDRRDMLSSHEYGAELYFVKPAHATEFALLGRMLGQFGVAQAGRSP